MLWHDIFVEILKWIITTCLSKLLENLLKNRKGR